MLSLTYLIRSTRPQSPSMLSRSPSCFNTGRTSIRVLTNSLPHFSTWTMTATTPSSTGSFARPRATPGSVQTRRTYPLALRYASTMVFSFPFALFSNGLTFPAKHRLPVPLNFVSFPTKTPVLNPLRLPSLLSIPSLLSKSGARLCMLL